MPDTAGVTERILGQVPSFIIPPDKVVTLGGTESVKSPVEGKVEPKDGDKEPVAPDSAAPKPESETLEPKPDTEKAEQRRQNAQRRIAENATKRAAEAHARAEAAERRNQELEARLTPQSPDDGPKMADFDDVEKFAKAREEFAVKKAVTESQARARDEGVRTAQTELKQNWETQTERGAGKYDDYPEIVGELHPTTPWAVGIMLAENGDDVAYHLGKHPAEVQKIMALPPFRQLLEIGKLSAKLSQAPVAPKQPSKAPAPITPVTGSAQAAETDLSAPMDPAQYFKLGNKMFRGR